MSDHRPARRQCLVGGLLSLALIVPGLSGCRRGSDPEPGTEAPGAEHATARPKAPTAVALGADGTLWLGGIDGQIVGERPDGTRDDRGPLHGGAVRRLLTEDAHLRFSIASDTVARHADDGRVAARWRLPGHHLNDARVLPDGDLLVAADRGDVARLGPEGAVRWRVRGHHGRATFALAIRPPAPGAPPEEAASVGADGRVSRWRLSDGAPLGEGRSDDGALLRVVWHAEHLYTLSARGRLIRWRLGAPGADAGGSGDDALVAEVQRETAVARVGGAGHESAAEIEAATDRGTPAATGLLADDTHLYVATRGGHVRSYRLPSLEAGPVFSPPPTPDGPAQPGTPAQPGAPNPRPDASIQAFDLRDDTLVVVHADGRVLRHAVPRRVLPTVRVLR